MTAGPRLWHRIRLFALAVRNLGLRNALHLKYQQYRERVRGATEPFALRSKHAAHPLWCRPHTSDAAVFYQIFLLREYSCLDDVADPKLIIDCGANVGYSSAYFLSRFPGARVIAVEPDPGNAELLERNLRPFGGRAKIVRSAVWSHAADLVIDYGGGDGREWARRVRECSPGELPSLRATDIGALLRESGEQSISILKMDVEGAEAVIFSRGYEDWLKRTDSIVIELHGEECRQVFARAIEERSFTVFQHEELTVCKGHAAGRGPAPRGAAGVSQPPKPAAAAAATGTHQVAACRRGS